MRVIKKLAPILNAGQDLLASSLTGLRTLSATTPAVLTRGCWLLYQQLMAKQKRDNAHYLGMVEKKHLRRLSDWRVTSASAAILAAGVASRRS